MRDADQVTPADLHTQVLRRLTRIFGEARAEALVAELLAGLGIARVETTDQLERLASALKERGGFEATAGAMLGVLAAMRRVNEP